MLQGPDPDWPDRVHGSTLATRF